MTVSGAEIAAKAIEILKEKPNGLHYMDWVREIQEQLPEAKLNTIQGTVWDLDRRKPDYVYKPARGLFRHTAFSETSPTVGSTTPLTPSIAESDFYKPFADWLVRGVEDCTNAIPLGGNVFKDKFGTPDVIGIYKSRDTDIIKIPTPEVISAEIKTDATDLIRAFGQACAYKIFSHKSYLVVPTDSPAEDLSRLDSLCLIFGIGLVLFDRDYPDEPDFEIRARPSKHEPDMFYVNKYLKMAPEELFS
jgi:hypothetical protein